MIGIRIGGFKLKNLLDGYFRFKWMRQPMVDKAPFECREVVVLGIFDVQVYSFLW